MPVRQILPSRTPEQSQLIDELEKEWRSPAAGAAEPVILEELDDKGHVFHVYVVWSVWDHLDRTQRGEIILDAAERVKPTPEFLGITIAIGLTPNEADRFGIKWR